MIETLAAGIHASASAQAFDARAAPTLKDPDAGVFYVNALRELLSSGIPFLLAGTYALSAYTGITRETKDLDIVCKAGDFPRILARFQDLGHMVMIEDDRWLGKVFDGDHFFDVIFASQNGTMPVNDAWFAHAREIQVFGLPVRIAAPTELIWSKCFIQQRYRYDGADVAHMLLRARDLIDWPRLLGYMEVHWEVLLSHLLNFRWIFPSERDAVPAWVLDELLDRLAKQRQLPKPQTRICRGRMFSRFDYETDVKEWDFLDAGSETRIE